MSQKIQISGEIIAAEKTSYVGRDGQPVFVVKFVLKTEGEYPNFFPVECSVPGFDALKEKVATGRVSILCYLNGKLSRVEKAALEAKHAVSPGGCFLTLRYAGLDPSAHLAEQDSRITGEQVDLLSTP